MSLPKLPVVAEEAKASEVDDLCHHTCQVIEGNSLHCVMLPASTECVQIFHSEASAAQNFDIVLRPAICLSKWSVGTALSCTGILAKNCVTWMAGARGPKGGQRPRHTGLLDRVLVQRVENYAQVPCLFSPSDYTCFPSWLQLNYIRPGKTVMCAESKRSAWCALCRLVI